MTDEEAVPREQDRGVEEQRDGQVEQEEALRRLQAEIERLTVTDHLLLMMQSLSALAVNRLGVTEESKGRKDPEQARLAIDAFKALMGLVEPSRPVEEMKAHKAVLAQLQMTYVAALETARAADEEETATETAGEDAP